MDINEALDLIHHYSPAGGLVMDLFAGTLVTSLASLRLNRRSVLFERGSVLGIITELMMRLIPHYHTCVR